MKKMNHNITAKRVILICPGDINKGNISIDEAISISRDYNLDIVQMNNADIPVCKLMDYQKEEYKKKKKAKKQHVPTTKKLIFRPNTSEHDLNRIIKQAQGFIDKNDNVVFIVKFKGREVSYAYKVVESFAKIEDNLTIPKGYNLKKDSVVNNNKMHLIISK